MFNNAGKLLKSLRLNYKTTRGHTAAHNW